MRTLLLTLAAVVAAGWAPSGVLSGARRAGARPRRRAAAVPEPGAPPPTVVLRRAQAGDLKAASRLLVAGFFGDDSWHPGSAADAAVVWMPQVWRSEQARLRRNHEDAHPQRPASEHVMLVAVDTATGCVVGYVDVDNRLGSTV